MKTERKIFVAFILNLVFSLFEFVGGIYTGSIAILSDAMHDFGDATSVGVSYLFEKKSKRDANNDYTYGYGRFSILGGLITTLILLVGSVIVVYNAINRLINPIEIKYDKVIIFAIIGFSVNLVCTFFTHGGHSINQKAVNLHMLEDVFGWLIVLLGAVVMKFTNFYLLDGILSILVAIIIIINSVKNLKEILDVLLLKTPKNVNVSLIKDTINNLEEVIKVSNLQILNLDGENVIVSIRVVARTNSSEVKFKIKHALYNFSVTDITLEIVSPNEKAIENPHIERQKNCHFHHHHH